MAPEEKGEGARCGPSPGASVAEQALQVLPGGDLHTVQCILRHRNVATITRYPRRIFTTYSPPQIT